MLICIANILKFSSYVDNYQLRNLNAAKEMLSKGVERTAIDFLEESLDINGNYSEKAAVLLAEIYYNNENTAKAEQVITSHFKYEDFCTDSYLLYADILEANGKIKEAIMLLEEKLNNGDDKNLKAKICNLMSKKSVISKNITQIKYATNLIPAKTENKWGYLSRDGQWMISPTFTEVTPFIEDIALVLVKDRAYFINDSGEKISTSSKKVHSIRPYINARAAIETDKGWIYIDSNFDEKSKYWDFLGSYSNRFSFARNQNSWDILNYKGKEVVIGFDKIEENLLGQAVVNKRFFAKKGDSHFLYNTKGRKVAGPFKNAKAFMEDKEYAAVMNFDNKWGFINSDGKLVIDYEWVDASSFSSSLAAVKEKNKWGFINRNGDLVFDFKYANVTNFSNGIALLEDHGKILVSLDSYNKTTGIFN